MEEAATVLAQLKSQAENLRAGGNEAEAAQIEALCATMAQMKAKAFADKQKEEDVSVPVAPAPDTKVIKEINNTLSIPS